MAEQITFVMVPPLALIFLVLGTIFIGVATPTEGGAMGAAGAIILAMMKRRLTFDLTRQAVESTAKLSAFVVFILVGARVFSLTFYGVDGHRWVEEMLVSMPGGQLGFLIFVNVFVFLLAFFLDFFEIAFIVIPLLGPAAERLGIDLIWFGVMLGVNMQTSFMHPPFGFALFYLRSVAPREPYIDRVSGKLTEPVTTGQIYWGAVPFVIIQCIGVALVIAFPSLVMHYKGVGIDDRSLQGQDRDRDARHAAAARLRAAGQAVVAEPRAEARKQTLNLVLKCSQRVRAKRGPMINSASLEAWRNAPNSWPSFEGRCAATSDEELNKKPRSELRASLFGG